MLKPTVSIVLMSLCSKKFVSAFCSLTALAGTGRVSAHLGWAGENDSRFVHPS